jgi:hypothetical protein
MDSPPHWEDQKSGSGSEKGDIASVDVAEVEKNEATSVEQEYLVEDYARDVSIKVSSADLLLTSLNFNISCRCYLHKMTQRSLP